MPELSPEIAHCDSCMNPFEVTAFAPFSNVCCPHCGAEQRVKRAFGPYTLVRRHAVGGMSMVLVAHDSILDREVALKILSEDFSADERRISAFEEEARITASFSHPHVVRVLKTGSAFGRFYIAMELVPGGHFEDQIRERGKIPEAEMLPLAIEVAQGLKAAHAAGLIHRDVKPGNILLDAEGHAKLVDFGLALVTQGGKAQATELWATPYYVPPETIEGRPEDFRSDIYAFGATLYHALTGKPSCGEESMATDHLREAKKNMVAIGRVEPALSAATCAIIDQAMAYEPADRFSSYDEMIARLEVARARLKTGGPSAGQAFQESSLRQAKHRRHTFILYMILGFSALALGMFGVSFFKKEKIEATQAAPPVVQPPPVIPDVPVAADIAKIYREAREALATKEFSNAAKRFTELSENPAVLEPTRTWAGIEAVIACFLQGDGIAARQRADASLKHAQSTPAAASPVTESLRTVLQDLTRLSPVSVPATTTQPASSSQIISWMIAGLKNWEQGMIVAAAPCFEAVVSAQPAAEDAWLADYQKIAGDYLADYQLLTEYQFHPFPADSKSCHEAIATLELTLKNLRTSGRARYNIRALQLDLTRHAKLLAAAAQNAITPSPTPPVQPDLPAIMAALADYAKDCRFADAKRYLQFFPKDPEGASRASLLAIIESAAGFLADLENDLTSSSVTLDLRLKSGDSVRQISVDALGSIFATDRTGKKFKCSWGDFTADSLIALHRNLVNKIVSEQERLRRHQSAIAFDWLAGNRERALTAAAALSQTSATFKQQWDPIASGLPADANGE